MLRKFFITSVLLLNSTWIIAATDPTIDYKVKDFDSVWDLSSIYLKGPNAWKEVVKINRLKNPDKIYPDQILKIPTRLIDIKQGNAILASLSGEVLVLNNNNRPLPSTSGMTLYPGYTIKTNANAYATLRLFDGSVISMPTNSAITLDKLEKIRIYDNSHTDIQVNNGKVQAQVSKQNIGSTFQFKTQTAIAAVRGTTLQFGLNQGSDTSVLEVIEGQVAFGGKNQSLSVVNTAEAASINTLGQVEKIKLPDAPAIDPKNTFQGYTTVRLKTPNSDSKNTIKLRLSNSSLFNSPLQEIDVTEGQDILIENLSKGIYFGRFTAISPAGIESKPVDLIIDRTPIPTAQTNRAAIQLSEKPRPITFTWFYNKGYEYDLDIYSKSGEDKPIASVKNITTDHLDYCCLSPGTYYWKISQIKKMGNDRQITYQSERTPIIVGPTLTQTSQR